MFVILREKKSRFTFISSILRSENSNTTACVSNEIPVIPDKSVTALFCFVMFVTPGWENAKEESDDMLINHDSVQ